MPSKLKSDTARTNGAKSHGPVTPEGLAKSSANSRTHGLAAKYTLLTDESQEHFQLLRDDYIDQFQPQSGVEMDLVEVMAIARWRLRRLLAIESDLFNIEIMRREKQIEAKFTGMDEDARMAWVFQKMADEGHSIAMVIRYEGSLNRSYDKALKQLLLLQSHRNQPPAAPPPPAPIRKIQNEPKPTDPRSKESGSHEARPQGAVSNPGAVSNDKPRSNESGSHEPRPQGAVSNPRAVSNPESVSNDKPRPEQLQEFSATRETKPTAVSEARPFGSALFLVGLTGPSGAVTGAPAL